MTPLSLLTAILVGSVAIGAGLALCFIAVAVGWSDEVKK